MTHKRQPGTYDPYLTVDRPGGKPDVKPRFRVLFHKGHLDKWNTLVGMVGVTKAQQFWDHVANRADQPPLIGTSTPMRGGHKAGKDGWSRIYHYEISGAGRIDYHFHTAYPGDKDKHPVVQVIGLDWTSH